jgi:hypothetical protein
MIGQLLSGESLTDFTEDFQKIVAGSADIGVNSGRGKSVALPKKVTHVTSSLSS